MNFEDKIIINSLEANVDKNEILLNLLNLNFTFTHKIEYSDKGMRNINKISNFPIEFNVNLTCINNLICMNLVPINNETGIGLLYHDKHHIIIINQKKFPEIILESLCKDLNHVIENVIFIKINKISIFELLIYAELLNNDSKANFFNFCGLKNKQDILESYALSLIYINKRKVLELNYGKYVYAYDKYYHINESNEFLELNKNINLITKFNFHIDNLFFMNDLFMICYSKENKQYISQLNTKGNISNEKLLNDKYEFYDLNNNGYFIVKNSSDEICVSNFNDKIILVGFKNISRMIVKMFYSDNKIYLFTRNKCYTHELNTKNITVTKIGKINSFLFLLGIDKEITYNIPMTIKLFMESFKYDINIRHIHCFSNKIEMIYTIYDNYNIKVIDI